MANWYDEPGIQMLCDCALHLASLVRGWADRIAQILEKLPAADSDTRRELVDELEDLVRPKRSDTAAEGAANLGDFLVMMDMSSMAWGLKPVDAGPGPVAEAGWRLQEQGPVFEEAKRAANEVLKGTGDGDLAAYRELTADNPPPPAPGVPHLRAIEDEGD